MRPCNAPGPGGGEARLGQNSSNSSRPPSSDHPRRWRARRPRRPGEARRPARTPWDLPCAAGCMEGEEHDETFAVAPDKTMLALRARARGDPEQLVCERMSLPSPGIGDVLLRVHAASFTPTELDWPSTWVDRAGRERHAQDPGARGLGRRRGVGLRHHRVRYRRARLRAGGLDRDGAAAEYAARRGAPTSPRSRARSITSTPPLCHSQD